MWKNMSHTSTFSNDVNLLLQKAWLSDVKIYKARTKEEIYRAEVC